MKKLIQSFSNLIMIPVDILSYSIEANKLMKVITEQIKEEIKQDLLKREGLDSLPSFPIIFNLSFLFYAGGIPFYFQTLFIPIILLFTPFIFINPIFSFLNNIPLIQSICISSISLTFYFILLSFYKHNLLTLIDDLNLQIQDLQSKET